MCQERGVASLGSGTCMELVSLLILLLVRVRGLKSKGVEDEVW